MNTENSNTNESNKFSYDFIFKLNFKNLNKNIELVNLSIYCRWKNIISACKDNMFKISALTLNDEFYLPDGSYSVSDAQYYLEYII